MKSSRQKLAEYGVKVPEIMLPADRSIMPKWAVIACDQYTSQKDYWHNVEEFTKGVPSTLNLIFPECYLEDPEPGKRINSINKSMHEYLSGAVLAPPAEGFILVKRDTPASPTRWGLVAAIDLEFYDFSPESTSMVRATEGTILERIPPRVRIREKAELELPHIMVLIDDPELSVIESFINETADLTEVYDFDLMMESGHITGYRIDSDEHISRIADALAVLGSPDEQNKKYGTDASFLFAMGDGNHSLATAKTIWENLKKDNPGNTAIMNSPARWALVELVNIYSEGIAFEAIHRVLFNCTPEAFFEYASNAGFKIIRKDSLQAVLEIIDGNPEVQSCGFCTENGYGIIEAQHTESSIAAGTFQNLIDGFIAGNTGAVVDYIHGSDVTEQLGCRKNNIGFFLPAIRKDTFFRTIVEDGTFPRKTFSMGEAFEKRFYIEARRISG